MLRIKLQRVGRKHDPSFRVVITDRRTGPKSNKHVAIVGNYDAIRKTTNLKSEEIVKWISNGAIPTDTVHNILVKEGVIKGKKRNVLPKKSPIIDEKKIEAEKAKAEEEKEKKKKAEKEEEEKTESKDSSEPESKEATPEKKDDEDKKEKE